MKPQAEMPEGSAGDADKVDLTLVDIYRARCPLCKTEFDAKLWRIIDLDANPDRQSDIRDGTLQRSFCPVCIGPGVERLGALCVVGRGPEGRARVQFAFDRKSVVEAFEALSARFSKRCLDYNLDPASIPIVGSGLVDNIVELGQKLTDFSGFSLQASSLERMQAAIALVFASDCNVRREILMENPDLVRPGSIRLLASIPDMNADLPRARVRPILGLLTTASRDGIDAAIASCRAEFAGEMVLKGLPKPVGDAYLDAFPGPDTLPAAELEVRCVRAERLLAEYPELHGDLKADLFLSLGEAWQALAADFGDTAGARARSWYARILDDNDPTITPRVRLEAHRGLSASWDARLEGDPADNNRQALLHAETSVSIAEPLSDEELALALMELGIARTRQVTGDPFANRVLAREALDRAELPGVSSLTSLMVKYNRALTWIEEGSGDIVGKIDHGIQILEVLREGASDAFGPAQLQLVHQSLGAALLQRGTFTGDIDDFGEAANEFAAAVRLAIKRGDRRARARLIYLHYAARVELAVHGGELPNPAIVLSHIDEIQNIYGPEQSPYFYVETERLRAKVLEAFPPPDAPEDAALLARERVVHTLSSNGMMSVALPDFVGLGRAQEQRGAPGEAARSYAAAAQCAEGRLGSASTSARRDEEIANISQVFSALVRTLMVLFDRGEADGWHVLTAMERGRARDLLEELGGRELAEPAGVPVSLLVEERELRSALGSEPEDNLARMLGTNADTGRRIMQRQALHARLLEIYDAMAASGKAGAAYVSLRRPQPPDLDSLRSVVDTLADDTGVLSFWIEPTGAVGIFARALTPIVVHPLEFTEADARALLEALEAQVEGPIRVEKEPLGSWQEYGLKLLHPFEREIRGCRTLVIVPHGLAHRFPFHALMLSAGKLLVEVVATQTVPSLAILRDLEAASIVPGSTNAQVLCSARTPNERESFHAEAELVAGTFGVGAILDAKRDDLLAGASQSDIIHVVCHGRFDDDDPLAAELILSDGPVAVRELLSLRLRASLVSLAACETGILAATKGDRLKGFAQALLLSGARTTLLSLWSVWSEPTRFWMEQFYRALMEPEAHSNRLAHAHRMATLATRRRYPDPTNWAPFILSGRAE
ncbi:CHAT domain-containing protein [Bradyrhizobium sp. RT6a]|uniref:CHAT domain-containing protein n=1 Tax=unclassified Bradyrhizobium TaxID=2631580 RepID=UPI0033966FA6